MKTYNFGGELTDISAKKEAGLRVLPCELTTAGPLIIESPWVEKRVSTGALGALDDPLVVQTKV